MMKRVWIGLVSALLSVAPASAAMITFEATSQAGDDTSVNLQQFDETLGTLTSVFLEVDAALEGVFSIDLLCDSRCGKDDTGSVRLDVHYFDGRLHTGIASVNFGCVTGVQCTATETALEQALIAETLAPVADFIGMGTFEIEARAANRFGAIVSLDSFQNTLFGRVTYDYVPVAAVPVPASLPLALFALGGLAAIRRKA